MEQFYLSMFTGFVKAEIGEVSLLLLKAATLNLVLTKEKNGFTGPG